MNPTIVAPRRTSSHIALAVSALCAALAHPAMAQTVAAVADMSADIEHQVPASHKAAVEPIHCRGARPVAVINTKRSNNAARGSEAFEHGLKPNLAAGMASPSQSQAAPGRAAPPA